MTTDHMTSEPPPPTPPPMRERRLSRPTDRVIAGVGSGLAQYFGIDPVLTRVGLVVSLFVGGIGVPLYLLLWIVMPSEAEVADGESDRKLIVTIGLLVLLMASWITLGVSGSFGDFGFLVPVLMVAAGIALLARRSTTEAAGSTPAAPNQPPPSPPPTDSAGDPLRDDVTDQLPVLYGGDAEEPTPDDTVSFSPPPPLHHDGPLEPVVSSEAPLGRIVLGLLLLFGAVVAMGELLDWFEIGVTVALAIALLIVGGAIVLSAFWGRGRGLIPLGILIGIALAISAAAEPWLRDGIGERNHHPVGQVAELEYKLGIGEMNIDLTDVDFEPIEPVRVIAELGIGELDIVVPADIEMRITADGDIGVIDLDGRTESGLGNDFEFVTPGVARGEVPDLLLDLDLQIGEGSVELR